MSRPPIWFGAAFAGALVLAFASAGQAQIFSPGPLARPHAKLEGLDNCLKCHVKGEKLSNTKCLDCHTAIKTRMDQKRGYHGRLKEASCQKCHRDHRGKDAALIEYPGGTQRRFKHALTGWKLKGAHKKQKCTNCHQRAAIADEDALLLVMRKTRPKTLLGLKTQCAHCHFDEHRGQLKGKCSKCHDESAFNKAPGFSHKTDAAFALTGKHKKVKCVECHEKKSDGAKTTGFAAARSTSFLHMKPVDHKGCQSCHDDPHRGKFGTNCTSCHSTAGWKVIKTSRKNTRFHQNTRFPLRGAHGQVACKICHGPRPGMRTAKFRGLKHKRCTDCHSDGHLGQIAEKGPDGKKRDCAACHTESAFLPTSYELEQHATSRFPLDGAHKVVSCRRCHKADAKWLKAQGAKKACSSCHADPHAGQFSSAENKKACAACHQTASFATLNFDHQKDSKFALYGKHKKAACNKCHFEKKMGKQEAVQYRGLFTTCAGCHFDPHLGQFDTAPQAQVENRVRCDRCHNPGGFSKIAFDHQDPKQTRFVLEGRHKEIKCGACHIQVLVEEPKKKVRRYKPLPLDCAGCHVDHHEGRFKGFAP
jgi:hypothetical protein